MNRVFVGYHNPLRLAIENERHNHNNHETYYTTTSEDVANGTTYLSVMEQNLSVLKEALG